MGGKLNHQDTKHTKNAKRERTIIPFLVSWWF
jgi:hypothetical protein